MKVKINNEEYTYKSADIHYQIGDDKLNIIANITLDNSYSLAEIAAAMKDFEDISIELNGDIYEHLNFSSAVKRYSEQEFQGYIQVVFTNEDKIIEVE